MRMNIGQRVPCILMRLILPPLLATILVVITITCASVIAWPVMPEDGSQKAPQEKTFEVIGPQMLRYSYDKLAKSKRRERISITVHNSEAKELELIGSVEIKDILDAESKPTVLIFQMGELTESGKFKAATTTKIGPAKGKKLAFELISLPVKLRPGGYKGEITLKEVVKNVVKNEGKTVPIALMVPRSKADDVEIVIKQEYYDYLDLVSHGNRSLVAATFRNKGNAALCVDASLTSQKSILNIEGNPVNLTFQRVVLNEKGERRCTDKQPVRIDPGDAVTLYFKLQEPYIQPAPGTYRAYLSVKAEDGSIMKEHNGALTVHVPSREWVGQTTIVGAVKTWLLEHPKQWSLWFVDRKLERFVGPKIERLVDRKLERFVDRKLGVDAVLWDILFWSFLAIGFFFLGKVFYKIKLFLQRNHLGTIEIEKLQDNTDSTNLNNKEVLELLLKDTLENLGIEPSKPQPVVPISTEVGELITKSGIAGAGILKEFKEAVVFVWGILSPPIGHKIAITLRKRTQGSNVEAIVEIKNARTGRSEEIKAGLIDEDAESAVRKAAHYVYLHEINQKRNLNRTPEWARFKTIEGFESYQDGKDSQELKNSVEAINKYKMAAGSELHNAFIRVSLGSVLEEEKRFLGATEVYLHVVTRWPEMIEPRYRLAVTSSYHGHLKKDWEDLKEGKPKEVLRQQLTEEWDKLKHELKKRELKCLLEDGVNLDELTEKYFLTLARCQWEYLRQELEWQKCFWRWLRTFNPLRWRGDIRTYLWRFAGVWPWGLNRRQHHCAVKIAQHCTEIQYYTKIETENKQVKVKDNLEQVKRFVEPRWFRPQWMAHLMGITWIARYNAACAYSLALAGELEEDNKDKGDWERKGVEHLRAVMRDPESASSINWLRSDDPDLETLRDCNLFRVWQDELGTELAADQTSLVPDPDEQQSDSIAQEWRFLVWSDQG